MKKLVVGACLACSLMLVSGCASKVVTSESKDSFKSYGAQVENSAVLKTVKGISIWNVDGKRIASIPRVMFGGAWDAVNLTPGKHSVRATKDGRDMRIGVIDYKADNEYLINQLVHGDTTYYWVENVTTGQVVFGNKKTREDFVAQE